MTGVVQNDREVFSETFGERAVADFYVPDSYLCVNSAPELSFMIVLLPQISNKKFYSLYRWHCLETRLNFGLRSSRPFSFRRIPDCVFESFKSASVFCEKLFATERPEDYLRAVLLNKTIP